jgi:hypothetical protein
VADLTGQPCLPTDRASADALAAVPGIRSALHEYGPDDVPDVPSRPLDELIQRASDALEQCGQARCSVAGRDVGALLTESQAHAATATGADRPRAYGALVTACMVAGAVTCARDRRCHQVTDEALGGSPSRAQRPVHRTVRAPGAGHSAGLPIRPGLPGLRRRSHPSSHRPGPTSEPYPRPAPKRCPVNSAAVRWALSPLDFRAHAVTEHDDHPIGVLIARCGHLLPMVCSSTQNPPGRRARPAHWRFDP